MQIAQSPAFQNTLDQVDTFAPYDCVTVLLEGEHGTGKTSLARYLHDNSPRRGQPFHRVDLGAIDESLSGSELFGHVAGAFTGAYRARPGHFVAAEGGTIFLDEVGKAPESIERRLLHAIEYRQVTPVGSEKTEDVDVRVVAATNVSLERLIDRGDFLPDLLHRFGYSRIVVPPLRQRRADILPLADAMLAKYAPEFGYTPDEPPPLHPELQVAIQEAQWPGNVRELESAITCLMSYAKGAPMLTFSHCLNDLSYLARGESRGERALRAVAECETVSEASRKMGVSRSTCYRQLKASGAKQPSSLTKRGQRKSRAQNDV